MTYLHQALTIKVTGWRDSNYSCEDFPSIREIPEYATDSSSDGISRYLRSAQFKALEIYWYLRLVENTPKISQLYKRLFPKARERRETLTLNYPSYILALAMKVITSTRGLKPNTWSEYSIYSSNRPAKSMGYGLPGALPTQVKQNFLPNISEKTIAGTDIRLILSFAARTANISSSKLNRINTMPQSQKI